MDYDLIYVDEGRNATRDHRTQRPGWRPSSQGPAGSRTVVVPQNSRPTVINGTAQSYYHPAPLAYQPAPMQGYQQAYYAPGYAPNYGPIMPSIASRFGMTSGELIDTGIQLLAAIMPLPAAPVAQGETVIDVDNLMTYQGALASHAKRDEQLRTVGTLLVRILK